MKLRQDPQRRNHIGLDLFNVTNLSPQPRNHLLQPLQTTTPVDMKTDNPINIHTKSSPHLNSLMDHFRFSEDVIAERCVHLLPYRDGFYDSLYSFQSSHRKARETSLKSSLPFKYPHSEKAKSTLPIQARSSTVTRVSPEITVKNSTSRPTEHKA